MCGGYSTLDSTNIISGRGIATEIGKCIAIERCVALLYAIGRRAMRGAGADPTFSMTFASATIGLSPVSEINAS